MAQTATAARRRPQRRRSQASTAARGYGPEHQALRAALLASLRPGHPCPRCGQGMWRWQPLELGHTDDRTGYNGLEHRACNRAAGNRNRQRTDSRSRGRAW